MGLRRGRSGDRPRDDESTWLAAEMRQPPEREVLPGLTVGELIAFHQRPPTPPGWVFEPSVAYARPTPGPPLAVHVYHPADPDVRRPAVVFVHGGGWTEGHPFSQIRRAALMAANGWVSMTITYRRATEARWPAQLDDVCSAVAWVRRKAGELGVDERRIALCGASAGGQLAALAGLDPSLGLAGTVLWYPVTDLVATPAIARQVELLTGGDPARIAAASPIANVVAQGSPTLTFAGQTDDIVPIETVRAFHGALDDAGVRNRLVEFAHAGHAFDFDPVLWTSTFEQAVTFLENCFAAVPDDDSLTNTERSATHIDG